MSDLSKQKTQKEGKKSEVKEVPKEKEPKFLDQLSTEDALAKIGELTHELRDLKRSLAVVVKKQNVYEEKIKILENEKEIFEGKNAHLEVALYVKEQEILELQATVDLFIQNNRKYIQREDYLGKLTKKKKMKI